MTVIISLRRLTSKEFQEVTNIKELSSTFRTGNSVSMVMNVIMLTGLTILNIIIKVLLIISYVTLLGFCVQAVTVISFEHSAGIP